MNSDGNPKPTRRPSVKPYNFKAKRKRGKVENHMQEAGDTVFRFVSGHPVVLENEIADQVGTDE